jgi:subtilase family serine protease
LIAIRNNEKVKRVSFVLLLAVAAVLVCGSHASASSNKLDREARPPFHLGRIQNNAVPTGLTPNQIRSAYNLTASGVGTVAIVDAYDNPNAESDLAAFSTQFGLPQCASATGCFIKHKMATKLSTNSGWILEESMDVQWAHSVAPKAKILLVEAKSSRLSDLLAAVAYAKTQSGVVSVSMSWGSSEFSGSPSYDSYFSQPGVTFYASSGDSGTGVQWPAVSANVVGVGGTTLSMSGTIVSTESAWSGSGGGISAYVTQPSYQSTLVISNGKRAVPDVSFDADPNTGVAVYDSFGYNGQKGWFQVGGTSLGSPAWAAINSLGSSVKNNVNYYSDALASYTLFFRDITSGSNGSCGAVCTATTNYDFITGLGSPLTFSY